MPRIDDHTVQVPKEEHVYPEQLPAIGGVGKTKSSEGSKNVEAYEVSSGGKALSDKGEYAARRPEIRSKSSMLNVLTSRPKKANPKDILYQLDGIAQIAPARRSRYLRPWLDALMDGTSQGLPSNERSRLEALSAADQVKVGNIVAQLAEQNAKQGGSLDLSSVFALQRQANGAVTIHTQPDNPLAGVEEHLDILESRLFGPGSLKTIDAAGTGSAYLHSVVLDTVSKEAAEAMVAALSDKVSRWPSSKIVIRSINETWVLTPEGTTRPLMDGEPDEIKIVQRGIQPALLLSDLDGTWLSGDSQAERDLSEGIAALKEEYMAKGIQLLHGYVTARPPERIMGRGLPEPDLSLTYNGGEIHYGWPLHTDQDGVVDHPQISDWRAMIRASGFDKEKVLAAIERVRSRPNFENLNIVPVGDIVNDPSSDASAAAIHIGIHTDSITLTPDDDPAMIDYNGEFKAPRQIEAFKWALTVEMENEINFGMSPVHPFHGKPFLKIDIASPFANKGYATRFIAAHMGVSPNRLMVAGDGGNDIEMMRGKDRRYAIVVGPEGSQLRERIEQAHPLNPHVIARPPGENSSLGVLEGVRSSLEDMLEHFERDPHGEMLP